MALDETFDSDGPGGDLSPAEWMELADLVLAKKFAVVFDAAYQGYATGDLDADAFGLRHFVSRYPEAVLGTNLETKD